MNNEKQNELQAQYDMLKSEIDSLDEDTRSLVNVYYESFKKIVGQGGGVAIAAFSLVATEIAVETAKMSPEELMAMAKGKGNEERGRYGCLKYHNY